jgi:hypothetical protein
MIIKHDSMLICLLSQSFQRKIGNRAKRTIPQTDWTQALPLDWDPARRVGFSLGWLYSICISLLEHYIYFLMTFGHSVFLSFDRDVPKGKSHNSHVFYMDWQLCMPLVIFGYFIILTVRFCQSVLKHFKNIP